MCDADGEQRYVLSTKGEKVMADAARSKYARGCGGDHIVLFNCYNGGIGDSPSSGVSRTSFKLGRLEQRDIYGTNSIDTWSSLRCN